MSETLYHDAGEEEEDPGRAEDHVLLEGPRAEVTSFAKLTWHDYLKSVRTGQFVTIDRRIYWNLTRIMCTRYVYQVKVYM